MPKEYEKIRDSLKRSGKPSKEAKRIAAATYNKRRQPGQAPVTGTHKKTTKKKPRGRRG